MDAIERTESARILLSLMLAVAVGFWAAELADYIRVLQTSEKYRVAIAKEIESGEDKAQKAKKDKYVVSVIPLVDNLASTIMPISFNGPAYTFEISPETNESAYKGSAVIESAGNKEEFSYDVTVVRDRRAYEGSVVIKLAKNKEEFSYDVTVVRGGSDRDSPYGATITRNRDKVKYSVGIVKAVGGYTATIRSTGPTSTTVITLLSGILFLGVLLCIAWWYARYIYRIQPIATFGTYFLDFIICSMFALAANSWTHYQTFLGASACGSFLLAARFVMLYKSPHASWTDRLILKWARNMLFGAFLIASISLVFLLFAWGDKGFERMGPLLPGILSLMGIVLTFALRKKIAVAVDIYSASRKRIAPMEMCWPKVAPAASNERRDIRQQTEEGLKSFDDMFQGMWKCDHVKSRVHAETDVRIQSYILSLTSIRTEHVDEIKKKAFMVTLSHWLDDLLDGRSETEILELLLKGPSLSDKEEEAKRLFQLLYQGLIQRHTNRDFFEQIYRKITESCSLEYNTRYVLLGLNRVAYGSVIFSPRISQEKSRQVLTRHNIFLKEWNVETSPFKVKVERILDEICVSDVGRILLGLTTKTVQEVAMSSEDKELDVSLSILFSILYAPLLYFHDVDHELEANEILPLFKFETDYDLWVPWLKKVRETIEQSDNDRLDLRLQQMEMAYNCLSKFIPKSIQEELVKVYIREH
jgi:hypothetical protein